ncbi:MAG: hypothetical protein H7Y42_01070 [Chitinophagaceae bacterium]|nr:hypothetical protein [Chitinophagaceae bacterium]
MKLLSYSRFSLLALLLVSLFSCTKKDDFMSEPLSDYFPLQTGKYITYRLDSMVFTNFGSITETRRYQLKYVVDIPVTDNEGRPAWRVYTYINDSTASGQWVSNGTIVVTPLDKKIEVTEDNLRVIKMHLPINPGFEWKGNAYLPFDPYGNSYDFSNDDDMRNWNFFYDQFEPTSEYRDQTYTDVYTIEQQDESENAPVINPSNYGYKNRGVEKYAKGIGLIFRHLELWEYQPNPSGVNPYKTGFGVIQWMVDHN